MSHNVGLSVIIFLFNVGTKARCYRAGRFMFSRRYTYAWQSKILSATGKRRVSLHVTLGKGMREFDYDAPWKSLNDAMKHAKLIVDDSCKYVEQGPVTFSRDWKNWGTVIRLEDL
jgi:hypothetical protein